MSDLLFGWALRGHCEIRLIDSIMAVIVILGGFLGGMKILSWIGDRKKNK